MLLIIIHEIFLKGCENLTNIDNGGMQMTTGIAGNWSYNSYVTYTCDVGYNLTSDLPMICSIDGSWNGTEPSCMPVDCMNISTPVHASVQYVNGTAFKMRAHIECEPGFNFSGSSVLTCMETGVWEPDLPTCNAISKHRNLLRLTHVCVSKATL